MTTPDVDRSVWLRATARHAVTESDRHVADLVYQLRHSAHLAVVDWEANKIPDDSHLEDAIATAVALLRATAQLRMARMFAEEVTALARQLGEG